MSKSSEQELNELHGAVARVLRTQIEESVTTDDGTTILTASPALLSTAIKFLKDNSITTSLEDSEDLEQLDELLRQKQNKRGGPRLRAVGEDE
jgi:hypothetical protein